MSKAPFFFFATAQLEVLQQFLLDNILFVYYVLLYENKTNNTKSNLSFGILSSWFVFHFPYVSPDATTLSCNYNKANLMFDTQCFISLTLCVLLKEINYKKPTKARMKIIYRDFCCETLAKENESFNL